MTSDNPVYAQALQEVKTGIDDNTQGLVKIQGQTAGDLGRIAVWQNNLIIQLLINQHSELKALRAELGELRKGKEAATSSAASTINTDELVEKLSKFSIGQPKPQKKKGTFYAFKDPYVILKEEQDKLKDVPKK
uniref:ORF2 protein n=1 Tax=Cacao swollen shoot virus TaxID=31559 RepID=A0A6G8IUT5_9VIRU|nr:ORF2 protein [Cacao swollen shoot virus]